jgi:flagellar assembly factor FliW
MQTGIIEEKMTIFEGNINSQIVRNEYQPPESLEIESRFGHVVVKPRNAINFLHGMPGIPGLISFCLTRIPNIKSEQFQLLQCLSNHTLSFIVVPSTYDNQLLEPKDLDDACAVLGINKENLLLLFIVTSHDLPTGRRLSVNAKAPVFIDIISKTAVQYIFQNNNYEIQHFIS